MANFNNVSEAYTTLEKRKQISATTLLKMQETIFAKVPRIKDIGYEITAIGAEYTMAKLAKDSSTAENLYNKMLKLQEERNILLINNGFNIDDLTEKHFCTLCNDTGVKDGKMCNCLKKSIANNRQKKLNALSPIPNNNFDDFSLEYYPNSVGESNINAKHHMTNVLEYCKDYARNFSTSNKSILMLGNAGLGKTHLACSIAKKCVENGFIVMYSSSQSLFSLIEENKYTANTIIEDITNCDLFILDDLGTEYLTNYSLSVLYNIINTRMIKGLPCIFTTNLTSQQAIITKYGEKIASRLLGSSVTLGFFGEDIRIKKR